MTYKVVLRTNEMQMTTITTYSSELVLTHAPCEILHSYIAIMLVISPVHSKLLHRAYCVEAPYT